MVKFHAHHDLVLNHPINQLPEKEKKSVKVIPVNVAICF